MVNGEGLWLEVRCRVINLVAAYGTWRVTSSYSLAVSITARGVARCHVYGQLNGLYPALSAGFGVAFFLG